MLFDTISVIIPHYNRPDLARRALLSICNQSFKPTEILLVDDCSSPENLKQLRELSSLATILCTSRNMSDSGARNFGAQHASGKWLAFLDDDDCWLPDKQERQVRYLEAHPNVEALGGGMTMVTPDGRKEYRGDKYTHRLTLASALFYTASLAQALMIRRDVFLELGGYDTRLRNLADYEFGIRLLSSGHETHYLGEPLFVYYHGGWPQKSFQLSKMFRAHIHILNMHAGQIRKEFGLLGGIRLKARCCKKYGLRKGRFLGRSVWAWGCILEAILGRVRGEFDE
jgi:glycosyltransferase involved in cell wall biosynthesis